MTEYVQHTLCIRKNAPNLKQCSSKI